MTASLLSLPDELLLAVAVYFMIPDRPLEIPSTFGPLTPWSRQKTIYVKPAQLLKEPFAADLFALCRVNKRLYNTASPLLRAEASFDYNTFSSVDLMKVNAVVQKNANIVRSLDISSRFVAESDEEEEYASDEESFFCQNLEAFCSLTSLVLDNIHAAKDVMRVIAGLQNLTALTLLSNESPDDDYCAEDDFETIDLPPLTALHVSCPGPRDLSLMISLRASLQDLCLMHKECYHEHVWNRETLFDQEFPKLRSLSLGPFMKDQSDAYAFRRFVLRHRSTLRELNVDFAQCLCIKVAMNLSWVYHIVKIMCCDDAEEWEGMDCAWTQEEDTVTGVHSPWGEYIATGFGCVVRESYGSLNDGPTRYLVEFGVDLSGFRDDIGMHINGDKSISSLIRMFQDQIFRSIEQMVLILPILHSESDETEADGNEYMKSQFDGFASLCAGLPHLRALSFYACFEPMIWSKDDSREISIPLLVNPERNYQVDIDRIFYRDWQDKSPYSSVDWASYPLNEGQVKLVNMWRDEELANIQSVMSSLMMKCKALEIVQWWIGDQGYQCDWVWRRVEGKLDEQSSETKTMSLTNDLRIPNTSNAPRKYVISALVGRMADYESNLL